MYFVILFLAPNWNTNCSQIYPKVFSTDFIFRQQENLVDNQKCQAEFRPLCNKILILLVVRHLIFKQEYGEFY